MSKKQESDLRVVQLVVDAQLAERDAEIAQLRATVAERDAEIAHMIKHMWDDVPVDAIRRYHTFTHYDAGAEYVYSTQQFDSDDMWIRIWLESLDGDA